MGRRLAYFPTPYPDELLYSVLARYHLRNCNISVSHTLEDLFGSPSATLDDLPARLGDLIERLPSQEAFTPAKLIQEHTMLPYYKPFIAPEWLDSANLNAYEEEMKICVMSILYDIRKRKDLHQTLHYCPKCYESDELTYGEPYWHRSHQVQGVLRCHRHGTWLIDSKIKLKPIGPKQPLISLGSKTFSDTFSARSKFTNSPEVKLHDWLAKQVYWLLNGNHNGIPCHPTVLLNRYCYHLEKMGLLYCDTGWLMRGELQRRFFNFYSAKFLIDISCAYDGSFTLDWLIMLSLPSYQEHRPIYHLLAMRFFGSDPKEILWDKIETDEPFGKGPWPCLNKVADHYLQPVIKECSISKTTTSTNLVTGTFICECGFQYERHGPDLSETNRTRFTKIVATGAVWDKELMKLFLDDYADVARILGVPHSFIAQKLTTLVENETENLSVDEFIQTRTRYRNKWQEICERFSMRHSIEILDWKGEILHRWFSKYDAEWFHENSPPIKLGETSISWAELDNKLAAMVGLAAEAMRHEMRKVCKTGISKVIDVWLNTNNLYKVPMTEQILASVVESNEEFALRRLSAVVADFKRRGEPLRQTDILRAAKISSNIARRLAPEIELILAEADGKQPFLRPEATLLQENCTNSILDKSKHHKSALQRNRERNVTVFSNTLP